MIFTEVVKVENGKFSNLSAHLMRIAKTANHFFAHNIDTSSLVEQNIPADMQKGLVKCRVVYSTQIISIEFQSYTFRAIRKLALIEDNQIEYGFKYQDRSRLNTLFEQRGDADDILIVCNGLITDTSFSNVVFEDSFGGLFTPDSFLLAGTKRQQLLANGTINERKIFANDLSLYTGVYLINAMIDVGEIKIIDIASVATRSI